MDVFGNSSYIPNQSGWAQTGFMPSLNSFTATNTTNTWSQTPPSNVPWGISYSQALPNVIRFTGQSDISFPHHSSISSPHLLSSIKRRLDESDEDSSESPSTLSKTPAKQFISEEKMAERMNEMHISQAFVPHCQPILPNGLNHSAPPITGGSESPMFSSNSTLSSNNNEEEDMMDESVSNSGANKSNKMPSLYFSEEIKNLKSTIDPLIPKAMIPRNLNSKALVLWTPRIGLGLGSNLDPSIETTHPSSPESSEDEAEFIRSDDPQCSVIISEIHEPRHRSEEEMAIDDL